MTGVQAIVEAARRELGDEIGGNPVRASCPVCGVFMVSLLTAPSLARVHCGKCRLDVTVYVARNREVLVATERRT